MVIAFGPTPPRLAQVDWAGVCCQASASAALFAIEGVGRYLVRDGREIVIDPEPGAHHGAVAAFLKAAVLGALLCQRGLLTLRGSAVEAPRGAALILGPVASGKSTTAAILHQRGHRLIADGLCAISMETGTAVLHPSTGALHLWRDVGDKLGLTAGREPEQPGIERFAIPLDFATRASPVASIFYLASANTARPAAEPVEGLRRLRLLAVCDHAAYYLGGVTSGPASKLAAMALASGPDMTCLRRSRADDHAELADLIEARLAS